MTTTTPTITRPRPSRRSVRATVGAAAALSIVVVAQQGRLVQSITSDNDPRDAVIEVPAADPTGLGAALAVDVPTTNPMADPAGLGAALSTTS